jgi:hypothetical protein
MKLTFLGTRGEIEARTSRHHMHSSLMVSHQGAVSKASSKARMASVGVSLPRSVFRH